MRPERASLTLLLILVAGCPANDPAHGVQTLVPPDQFLDYNEFVCSVQPVLIRRCSYLACHGNPDHALRIYSVGKLRLGDTSTRNLRDSPLTADEVELNFQSASGTVYAATAADCQGTGDPTAVPLLQKPLAARFGGSEHHGIAIFPQFPATTLAADPDWSLLTGWVGGAKQPMPPVQSCQDFFTSLGLPPRGM